MKEGEEIGREYGVGQVVILEKVSFNAGIRDIKKAALID